MQVVKIMPLTFETLCKVLYKWIKVTVKDEEGNRATFSGELTGVDGVDPEGIDLDNYRFRFPLSAIVEVGVVGEE